VTFQAVNIDEARHLYDQLAVICPIMVKLSSNLLSVSLMLYIQLAISAATPVYRGYLCDIDCRWDIISGSVDDRTKEELGLEVQSNSWLSYNFFQLLFLLAAEK